MSGYELIPQPWTPCGQYLDLAKASVLRAPVLVRSWELMLACCVQNFNSTLFALRHFWGSVACTSRLKVSNNDSNGMLMIEWQLKRHSDTSRIQALLCHVSAGCLFVLAFASCYKGWCQSPALPELESRPQRRAVEGMGARKREAWGLYDRHACVSFFSTTIYIFEKRL